MGLSEKSKHNLELARLLEDQCDYNVCTNRLYYSFYQNVVQILEKKAKINLEGRGSHIESFQKFLIEVYFKNSILQKDEIEVEMLYLRSNFANMGTFRIKADYKNDDINKDDFEKFKLLYTGMKTILEI